MEGKDKKQKVVLCDSGSVNSYGFSIDLSGMDLSRFKNNPVMLYQHDSERLIGRWEDLCIEDGRLLATPVFDEDDETGKKVAGKVERGFLKGASIGIIIKEMLELKTGYRATQTELMEASMVSIPADAGAVILYDNNRNNLTFEDVKLQFNINQMDKTETNTEMEALQAQIKAKDDRIAELEQQLAAMHDAEIDSYLQTSLQANKLTEKEVAGFKKLASADFDTVKSIIDSRDAKASVSLKDMSNKTTGRGGRYEGLSWDQLDRAGLLSGLKSEDPDLYQKKFNEKFKK